MTTDGGGPSVEIRVHGIGNHDDWSQLGSPQIVVDGSPRGADTAVPPVLPAHPLRLVNWARTSRRVGWLWYLAMPYTLVNAAGFMQTPSADDSRAHKGLRVASLAAGCVLSVLTYVWLVAIVETIARRSFLPVTSQASAGVWIAVAVGAVLIVCMLFRRSLPGRKTADCVLAFNCGAILSATIATASIRPAHRHIASNWVPDIFTTYGPSRTYGATPHKNPLSFEELVANGELVPYLDALVTVSLASIVITLLIAAGVLLRGFTAKVTAAARPPACATALALTGSVVLMITVGSAVRLFLDNFSYYLSKRDLLPLGDPDTHAPYSARVMLPPLNPHYTAHNDWLMDLLPLLGISLAVALAVGLILSNLLPNGAGRPRLARSKKKKLSKAVAGAKWRRRLVLRLPATLPTALLAAAMLWGLLAVVVWKWVLYGPDRVWNWVVVGVQAISVLAIFLLVAGRNYEIVAKPFGMLGDLLGFWPITSHPLSGTSYRAPVIKGIKDELAKPKTGRRVLVGHSQGSVLCAWAISELAAGGADEGAPLDLVTCGSPLASLYGVFFPASFDGYFFARVQANTTSWANFWRDTDPIATMLPAVPQTAEFQIVDPDTSGRLHVHGDYWIAAEQRAYIDGLLSSDTTSS